jgi:hypothetical protein
MDLNSTGQPQPAVASNDAVSATTITPDQNVIKFTSSLRQRSTESSGKSARFKESGQGLVRRSGTKNNLRRKQLDSASYCKINNKFDNLNRGSTSRPITGSQVGLTTTSLCDVSGGGRRQAASNHLTNTLSKEEMLLIKKYTSSAYKSASAVVKMPTLTSDAGELTTTTTTTRVTAATTVASATMANGSSLLNRLSNTNQLKKLSAQQSINRLFMPARSRLNQKSQPDGNESSCTLTGQVQACGSLSLSKQMSTDSAFASVNTNTSTSNAKSKLSLFKKSVSFSLAVGIVDRV